MTVRIKTWTRKCLRCGHVWQARRESPRACPKCKRYDYNKK